MCAGVGEAVIDVVACAAVDIDVVVKRGGDQGSQNVFINE